MRSAALLFEDYAEHHRTPGNKWCHRFGIPMIVVSLFGMLSFVTIPAGVGTIDAAMILIALSIIYYARLGLRFAMAMLVVSTVFYLVGRALPLWIDVLLFLSGWILQFVGHGVYEKRSPAFLTNLVHLLVGPLWIMNDLVPLTRGSQRIESAGS